MQTRAQLPPQSLILSSLEPSPCTDSGYAKAPLSYIIAGQS